MATATANESDSAALQARKKELLALISVLFGHPKTGYKALTGDENDNARLAAAAKLEAAYRELAEVTQELGEADFSRSAREYVRSFAIINDPSYVAHELNAARQSFAQKFQEAVKELEGADPQDPNRQEQYRRIFDGLRGQLAQMENILGYFGLGELAEVEAQLKEISAASEMIEKRAQQFNATAAAQPEGPEDDDWRTLAEPPPFQSAEAANTQTAQTQANTAQASAAGGGFAASTSWTSTSDAFQAEANQSQASAERLRLRARHRRTRIAELDRLRVSQTSLAAGPENVDAYHGEFKVRPSDSVEGLFWLAPVGDTFAPEIPVYIDKRPRYDTTQEALNDKLSKANRNQIASIQLVKRYDEFGRPIFAVYYAEAWRDPEKGVTTATYDPKTRGYKTQSIKYSKEVYTPLNVRHTDLADLMAQQTRIDLVQLDRGQVQKPQTKRLLELAKSLDAFQKSIKTSELEDDYVSAINILYKRLSRPAQPNTPQGGRKKTKEEEDDEAWRVKYHDLEEQHKAWEERRDAWIHSVNANLAANQTSYTPVSAHDFAEIDPIHRAVLQRVYEKQIDGKDAFELTACKFYDGPLTYEFDGQKKSIQSIGHNLFHDDDLQFLRGQDPSLYGPANREHQALWQELQKEENAEKLLSYAASHAILRSITDHASKTCSQVDKNTGERIHILTDPKEVKDTAVNYITYEHDRLANSKIFFTPLGMGEDIIPGYDRKKGAKNYAEEHFQETFSRAISKLQLRAGAQMLNGIWLNDQMSEVTEEEKKLQTHIPGPDEAPRTAEDRDKIIEDTQQRIHRLEKEELPKNFRQIKDGVNIVRQNAGMPPIGRRPVEDWKATVGVMEIVTGSVLKEVFGAWGEVEKPMGLV